MLVTFVMQFKDPVQLMKSVVAWIKALHLFGTIDYARQYSTKMQALIEVDNWGWLFWVLGIAAVLAVAILFTYALWYKCLEGQRYKKRWNEWWAWWGEQYRVPEMTGDELLMQSTRARRAAFSDTDAEEDQTEEDVQVTPRKVVSKAPVTRSRVKTIARIAQAVSGVVKELHD